MRFKLIHIYFYAKLGYRKQFPGTEGSTTAPRAVEWQLQFHGTMCKKYTAIFRSVLSILSSTILHYMENVMVCDSSLFDSSFLLQIR